MRVASYFLCVFCGRLRKARAHPCFYSLFVILTLFWGANSEAGRDRERLKIAYVAPDTAFFWKNVDSFTFEVARQLNVDIIKVSYNAAFPALRELSDIFESDEKPDYLLFHYFNDIGARMLELADNAGVKSFSMITEITEDQIKNIGLPREKYTHWIGHMSPDDIQAGQLLAETLIRIQQSAGKGEPPKMIAVSGDPQASATILRDEGLLQTLKKYPNLELKRHTHINWSDVEGAFSTYHLLKMYPDTNIIWGVNDTLAIGGIAAVEKAGKQPGKDIFIGGIDWTRRGLEHVAKGSLSTTLGGHFMEAGWGLVLLVDYHHGYDFKEELGTMIRGQLTAITKDNVDAYLSSFPRGDWSKLDVKQFSKHYNPSLKEYNFSILKLLNKRSAN